MTQKKLTPNEIYELYDALPTEAAFAAIKAGYDDLEKIYEEFIINTLKYESVEDAIAKGKEIVSDSGRHPEDVYRAELLQEVILQHSA